MSSFDPYRPGVPLSKSLFPRMPSPHYFALEVNVVSVPLRQFLSAYEVAPPSLLRLAGYIFHLRNGFLKDRSALPVFPPSRYWTTEVRLDFSPFVVSLDGSPGRFFLASTLLRGSVAFIRFLTLASPCQPISFRFRTRVQFLFDFSVVLDAATPLPRVFFPSRPLLISAIYAVETPFS